MNDYRYGNEEPRQGNGEHNLNAQLKVRKRSRQDKPMERRLYTNPPNATEMQDLSANEHYQLLNPGDQSATDHDASLGLPQRVGGTHNKILSVREA